MKLNKLISIGAAMMVSVSAFAVTPTHFTQRLITGTYLCLSNGTALTTGGTNSYYYSYSAGTNVLSGSTNAAGMLIPSPVNAGVIFPDANVDINPNLALQVVIGFTNNLFLAGVQSPVMLNTVWTNPAPYLTNGVVSTNSLQITLTAMSSGDFNVPDTTGSKTFTFTVGQTNQVATVTTTNLPTAFLQGCYGFTIAGTNTVTGAGQGVIINGINLVGWKP